MADNERLLESHLKWLESESDTDWSVASTANQATTPQVALIMALRDVAPPAREVDSARERVRGRVFGAILAEDEGARAEAASQQPGGVRDAVSTTARVGKRHILAAVAAIFLLTFLGSWVLSSAASGAAPNSPLYGLKRADEWLALHTAWSDQQRGKVFATIAWRRLSDATFESSRHNDSAAQRLLP